jgi:pilus assembly protein Flp/PilA
MLRRVAIRFLKDENGATAIEYGLIAALVAVGAIAAVTAFGGSLTGLFGAVEDKAGGAMDAASGSI